MDPTEEDIPVVKMALDDEKVSYAVATALFRYGKRWWSITVYYIKAY